MGLLSFVAIDVETTGGDPSQDRIIEIGAVKYVDGREVATFSHLCDPQAPVPLRIQNLTGITPDMLRGKPTVPEVMEALADFLGELPLVAHNAAFDVGFLGAGLAEAGLPLRNPVYDTLELARIVVPRAKGHRLNQLVELMGVQLMQHHRAEDDARACGEVFLHLAERIGSMDVGLLRFVLSMGEPANWPMAPLFRAELDRKEGAGEQPSPIMQWVRPYDGVLHKPEEEQEAIEPIAVRPDLILSVLGPGGVVSDAFPSYENRPQQLQMAAGVTRALNEGRHMLMEAGTGTGKSLAYLVPAFAFAKKNQEKVAVATHTINLQEQLWEKDIPFLQEALQGTELDGVTAALVKGRPNYICLRKWEENAIGADFLTSEEERSFQIRLATWLSETETGDRTELNLTGESEAHWRQVQSETETCLGPKCKWYRNHCFAYRARRKAKDADILVLNHAVLFADINAGNLILPPFRHLILDEAHHVEDVATQNLGVNLENIEIYRALTFLFRSAGQGFLPTLKRRLPDEHSRIPARPPVGLPSEDHLERLIDLTFAVRAACDELFRLCAQLVESRGSGEEDGGRSLRLTEAVRFGPLWEALEVAKANAVLRLKNLAGGLAVLGEIIESFDPPMIGADRILVDIGKQSGILNGGAKAIESVLSGPGEGEVAWIEASTRREFLRVTLRSAPIDVGQVLSEKLFERLRSVVLTSATLSVGGGFDHVKHRLGLTEIPADRVQSGIVTSPFAYRRQSLLVVPEDLPSPKDPGYTQAVQQFLKEYLVQAGGRTLVLFTSHRQLRQVYGALRHDLEGEGLFLLGQGLDGARGRLVEEFKSAPNAVLFGSASFWEGVDIPGDGLTSVILVRLPFTPPGDPVMEARTEDLQARGLSPFFHLSLPQAIIKFKQGFGRLVRTKQDHGVVVVLDHRISHRHTRYGRQFLSSLPGPSLFMGSTPEAIARAMTWLKQGDEA